MKKSISIEYQFFSLETDFLLSVLAPLIGAEIIDLNHCFT
jgi:hypothetical protein